MDPMSTVSSPNSELSWLLVYTKVRAEAWTDINLRNQGFATLLPRVASRSGFALLFPRYVFVGFDALQRPASIHNTLGVMYVVQCGGKPARVPHDIVAEIRGRMNENGVVKLDAAPAVDPLFARRERDRVRTLIKLTEAGYRVKTA
jgi:Transcription termination factor nusG